MRRSLSPIIWITVQFFLCAIVRINSQLDHQPHSHVKMEESIPRPDFVRHSKSPASGDHELIFAVQQKHLNELESIVLERSTPGSSKYQQWMSYEQVGEMTRNELGAQVVIDWLESSGVEVSWKSTHSHYIKATTTIQRWEKLLNATFYRWRDQVADETDELFKTKSSKSIDKNKDIGAAEKLDKQKLVHRAIDYSLPSNVAPHLSSVFNTVQTPSPLRKQHHVTSQKSVLTDQYPQGKSSVRDIRDNHGSVNWESGSSLKEGDSRYKLTGQGSVTIDGLNRMYKVNSNIGNASLSQCIFSTQEEYFSTVDLENFQQKYGLTVQPGLAPNGFSTAQCSTSGDPDSSGYVSCYEGNLDMQYLMGVAQVTEGIYWYVPNNGGQDPFTAWAIQISNDPNPPLVGSISWGANEAFVAPSYKNSFNNEAMKLAAQGVTIAVATGDDGAVSQVCACGRYEPIFPASSPWVTAVGATQGPEDGDAEIACQSQVGGVITTGGGFSKFFGQPAWQAEAATAYFAAASTAEQSPISGYNPAGRGYPDVSMIGVAYETIVGGETAYLYGTSASAPVFAGLVSLVNAERYRLGKGPIGFLNPTMYTVGANRSSSIFNDVTSGHNRCCRGTNPKQVQCCATGFYTSNGWDPVTGWGSVNYDQFAALFDVAQPYTAPSAEKQTFLDTITDYVPQTVLIVGVVLVGVFLLTYCYQCVSRMRRNRQSERYEQELINVQIASVESAQAAASVPQGEHASHSFDSETSPEYRSHYYANPALEAREEVGREYGNGSSLQADFYARSGDPSLPYAPGSEAASADLASADGGSLQEMIRLQEGLRLSEEEILFLTTT